MRQLTYLGDSQVAFVEVEDPPSPGPDQVLVRPLAVARCDLDRAMVAQNLFPGPFALGHETVAEVIETGGAVARFSAGDRVTVPFQVSCGRCPECLCGRFAACATARGTAGAMFGFGAAGGGHGGALSDTLLIPFAEHMQIPPPPGISPAVLATLPDNVTDAYRAVAPALGVLEAAPVLILGGELASIGLYATALAVALGSSEVRYVDTDPKRCQAASALGARTEQVNSWPRRLPSAPITVDASGDPAGLVCALRSTAAYGTCTSVSIYFAEVALPLLEMYARGVTFHTSRADSRRHLPAVVELVERGVLDPLCVPTTIVDWSDADTAWLEPAIKLVVSR